MIAVFTTQAEAQAYANKIHSYLTANRPDYNATKWGDPISNDTKTEWYVKSPPEQEKQLWKVPITTTLELSKSVLLIDKYPELKEEIIIKKR